MKFFSISESLNKKIIGHYPQVKNIIYNCNVWSEPKFIEHIHFSKINFDPIIANPVLYNNSKLTDLISVTGMGFTLKLLISRKLKDIITRVRKTGIQMFKNPIVYKDQKFEDYWILNMYEVDMNFIDIQNSEVMWRKRKNEGGTFLEKINFESIDEFEKLININKLEGDLFLNRIKTKEKLIEDFFLLRNVSGGAQYIVSENLKNEIEDAGCTGIEFMPTELTLNEWLAPGGEREKIYGKI